MQFLRNIPLFSSLTKSEIEKIYQVCRKEEYNSGQVIIDEGSLGDECFIVLDGMVEIWKNYNDLQKDSLAVCGKGRLFGEMALIDDLTRSATVTAKKPTKLLSIKKEDFNRIITENSSISHSIMKAITGMVRQANASYIDNLQVRNKELKEAYQKMKVESEERQLTQKAMEESEERYRSVFENTGAAMIIIEEDDIISMANAEFEKLSGYPKKEIEGVMHWTSCFVKDDLEKMQEEKKTQKQNNLSTPNEFEMRFIGNHGDLKHIFLKISKIPGTNKRVGSLINITDKKRTEDEKKIIEAQFYQAQKIEAVGTLAGGIAHDFNNLLMAIQGNASLTLLDMGPDHRHYDKLKKIQEYVKNGANLTKQLLGYARGGKYETRSTDINELVKRQNYIFKRTKKEITVKEDFEENVWRVEVDRGQIEQVLMNMYINAWQAMPGGGNLYVITRNVNITEFDIKTLILKLSPGKYIKISITDTGVGMDEKTLERVFDPFFTTKEIGRGTGLGLASAYGIIKNHSGSIKVHSQRGNGATFDIYLPATEKEIEKKQISSYSITMGSETILLIDDEAMILDVGKQMLKQIGYKVLVADSGKVGVRIFKSLKQQIDLVILDVIMPEISGRETFSRLKEIYPEVKVLLSSGYAIDGEATEIMNQGCHGFIQKPFNLEQLSQKIRKIIDV